MYVYVCVCILRVHLCVRLPPTCLTTVMKALYVCVYVCVCMYVFIACAFVRISTDYLVDHRAYANNHKDKTYWQHSCAHVHVNTQTNQV